MDSDLGLHARFLFVKPGQVDRASECKSEERASASAKIELFEAGATRYDAASEGVTGGFWVHWTFYVDGNMTKAMTHGWAVCVAFITASRQWRE